MANRRGRRSRRQRRIHHHPKIHRIIDGADFINSMPDDILHHILSFIPTDLAIRTSVLSRRWRHAWCELPCLNFERTSSPWIDQTLSSYRALKIMSFCLHMTNCTVTEPQFASWVEFAMSHNVDKLSLRGGGSFNRETYRFPDFFYLSSSLKQLRVEEFYMHHPGCTVSWNSLRRLTLSNCNLYNDESSIANILSGSPIIETLRLSNCGGLLDHLDLSKSPSLRSLEIDRGFRSSGQMEIVAPHIHYLSLKNSHEAPCTLVDVSSLAEARLNIHMVRLKVGFCLKAVSLQTMVLQMLAKLQNVERLTFAGESILQVLSRTELCGVPFPTLNVQTLTVLIARSVIPGIARLLQNSPGLKKLIAHKIYSRNINDRDLEDLQGLNSVKCWRSKYEVFPTTSKEIRSMSGCTDATSILLASFMKLVLRKAKTLEKMVVWLARKYFNDEQLVEEVLQMVGTLSHNSNVSIVLKRRPNY